MDCDIIGLYEKCNPHAEFFKVGENGKLIGYRSRISTFMAPDWVYEVGKTYVAELFSTSVHCVCHPGLHIYSRRVIADYIIVEFDLEDLHSVGPYHRVRKFKVIG